uniref:Uncharacterized protein n=1 Tax=Anguilla anguilla TaxID=7936 RepID=A0A0E9U8E6_ANGAN
MFITPKYHRSKANVTLTANDYIL